MLAFNAVTFLAVPVIPLSLLANEAKWVLDTWSENPMQHAPIYETGGLYSFSLAAAVACFTALLGLVKAEMPAPPGRTTLCNCLRSIALLTFPLAAVCSIMVGNLKPKNAFS